MSNLAFRFATVQGQNIQWFLRRHRAVTPRQLAWLYLSLCLVSLGVGAAFWLQGAKLALPFAWTQVVLGVVLIGMVFMAYAKHATDGEKIYLRGAKLVVELEQGGKLERAEFQSDWVRIEPRAGDRSLIEVSGQGRSIDVGRFVRPELRPVLAKEIRMALRGARSA